MAILHFVGEHISTSLMKNDEDEFIRVAKESNPDEFIDFNPDEWNELFTIVNMIMTSNRTHRTMERQITIIPLDPPEEE